MPTEDVMRNKARAVSGWLGPFSKKTFSTFPEYEVGGASSGVSLPVYSFVGADMCPSTVLKHMKHVIHLDTYGTL